MSISRVVAALFALLVGQGIANYSLAGAREAAEAASPVASAIRTQGGAALSDAEIAANQITIYPDGRNLPAGQGTALQGGPIYAVKCAVCHGAQGEGLLGSRLVGREGYREGSRDILQAMSVGAWPTATTIFDFIRRAMPHFSPKTLTDDEVYQLTAWILHSNDIIGNNSVMNKDTLPQVKMPTSNLTINVYEQQLVE